MIFINGYKKSAWVNCNTCLLGSAKNPSTK